MKYLVVFVIALAALAAADEDWKPIVDKDSCRQIHEDCSKEAGLSSEQNVKVLKIDYDDEKEVQKYLHCCVIKMGLFADDKGFCVDRLMAQYNAMFGDVEAERENVKNCVENNEEKASADVWAFRVITCIANTKIGELLKKSDYAIQ